MLGSEPPQKKSKIWPDFSSILVEGEVADGN